MNEQLVVRDARQAIQQIDQSQSLALDAVGRKAAIDDLLNKVALVQEVMTKVMHDGEHYGKIPGCGDKPALLKAGAEKLGMTFRLKAQFDVQERDLGRAHREYSVRCTLSDGNMGVGSCSTMESKYRYRQGERRCPKCGKASIIAGKPEFGGGWLCWAKKGGCGEKFASNEPSIISQSTEKVEHDNPADYYNTCLKMGKKRAHVDAIITATACSDIFTQDVEEMVQTVESNSPTTPTATPAAPTPTQMAEALFRPNLMDKIASAVAATKKPEPHFATEKTREWMIEKIGDRAMVAREYAIQVGLLLDSEELTDWPLDYVPIDKDQLAALMKCIQAFEQGDQTGKPYPPNPLPAVKPDMIDVGHGKAKPSANPDDPDSPDAAWRSFPMPWGKHAGTPLGELDKKYLFGLAMNYEVETEYNGKPKKPETIAKDQLFRDMLDQCKLHYGFTEKE